MVFASEEKAKRNGAVQTHKKKLVFCRFAAVFFLLSALIRKENGDRSKKYGNESEDGGRGGWRGRGGGGRTR